MAKKKWVINSLVAASTLVIGGLAHAVPVVGSSGGSFSGLASCDNSGSDQDCRIVNTSNGSSTQVQWGSTSNYSDFVTPSVLTSVDLGINTNSNGAGLGVAIARLDWYNSATLRTSSSLDSFDVNWTLALDFAGPSGPDAHGGETFALRIANPINPTGDTTYGFELSDLSSLRNSVQLSGVTMSNLRYSVVDGAGSGSSWFSNNSWYNSEYNWSSLYILADFTSPSVPVPEPSSLALLGLGLLGVGLAARRKSWQRLSQI